MINKKNKVSDSDTDVHFSFTLAVNWKSRSILNEISICVIARQNGDDICIPSVIDKNFLQIHVQLIHRL